MPTMSGRLKGAIAALRLEKRRSVTTYLHSADEMTPLGTGDREAAVDPTADIGFPTVSVMGSKPISDQNGISLRDDCLTPEPSAICVSVERGKPSLGSRATREPLP